MIRRTSEQWLALIDQHKTSGLTQTAFAKQQGIDPSYFSQRKQQLLAWQQDDHDGFVELTPQGVQFCQPMVLKKRDVVMKMFIDTPKIYLHKQPVDFRKSINGLEPYKYLTGLFEKLPTANTPEVLAKLLPYLSGRQPCCKVWLLLRLPTVFLKPQNSIFPTARYNGSLQRVQKREKRAFAL
jgi:hypothetical protein